MSAEILPVTPTTAHRAKMAYIYIRQSSLMQVTRHAESTDLQYSLVERAVALGWPRERVELIDEDLGKSGAQAEAHGGFQRLLAEMSLARVGLVLSFDASRLARNKSRLVSTAGSLLDLWHAHCRRRAALRPSALSRPITAGFIWNDERGGAPSSQTTHACRSSEQGRARRTPSGVASGVISPSHRRSDFES